LLHRQSIDQLLIQIDVIVGTSLVYNFDVEVLVLHDFVLDGAVVSILAVIFDFAVDVRVFRENLVREELLTKRESLYLRDSHVNELGLGVVEDVVVAEETV